MIPKKENGRYLVMYSKRLVDFFAGIGIPAGNKKKNQSTIPHWVYESDGCLRACLRGLIDTDGSVFLMSRKDPHLLRISFVNNNKTLLEDTRTAFIQLGFHPSIIVHNRQFFISRKGDIQKYLNEIGFANKKHLDRIKILHSPVV